jgi:hypothetical protein
MFIPLALAAILVTGCATPEPVRDLASRGAGTVTLAEDALRDYLAASNAQLQARNDLLRSDAEIIASENADRERTRAFQAEAKIEPPKDSVALIRRMAEIRQTAREKQQKTLAKIAVDNTLDTDSIAQAPTGQLDAAKKSFGALSEELSADEWLALAGKYAKVISEGIDKLDPTANR